MTADQQIEFWMRGPVEGIPSLLQPVAHALLQAEKEIDELMSGFPVSRLWDRPAGLASPGFHLQHIRGVLDRLFTYARSTPLDAGQLKALKEEGIQIDIPDVNPLLTALHDQISNCLAQLAGTDPATLNDFRGVGRKQLPSTVMGLMFHAAEHTMRHVGQLIVTVRILETK